MRAVYICCCTSVWWPLLVVWRCGLCCMLRAIDDAFVVFASVQQTSFICTFTPSPQSNRYNFKVKPPFVSRTHSWMTIATTEHSVRAMPFEVCTGNVYRFQIVAL